MGKEKVDAYLYGKYKNAMGKIFDDKAEVPVTRLNRIRQDLSDIDLIQKEQLIRLLELMQAAMDGEVEKVISLLSRVDNKSIWPGFALLAISRIEAKATKKQLKRISALGDKVIANTTSAIEKQYLQYVFDNLKKRQN